MKKSILAIILLTCGIAAAQNWTTVTATNITDLNQQKLAAGQLCFLATDQNDNPISIGIGGGGQQLRRQFCSAVAAGAVASFTVPNPANTLPTGVYYRVTVKDSSTGQEVLRYTQVSFTGAAFNFDNYAPLNLGTPAPLSGNSVAGNLSVTGNVSATGSLSGSNLPPGTVVTGTGTTNRITKFTNGASGIIGNSGLSDDGTTVSTSENVTVGKFNNIIYVDGTKYPITQAGVQQALTDACTIGNGTGTEIVLPNAATIQLSNVTGAQFTSTCPVHMHGSTMGSFWFIVATGVPSTVPTFLIKPSGVNLGFWEFDHFRLATNNPGATGGDWFFLDSTNGSVNDTQLHHLFATGESSTAWFLNMNATIVDQFYRGHIYENNRIEGGINFNTTSVSDNWVIEHNQFSSGDGGNTNPCVNATTTNGSSHIIVAFNIGSCKGGFFISHGTTQPKVIYNQIEQDQISVEANQVMVDLIGDIYAIDKPEIRGNNFASLGNVTNGLRLNGTTNAVIAGNVFGPKAVTGVGIILTASPTGTFIDPTNEFILSGGSVAMTNATGVNPFTYSFPKLDGTLPGTISNATDGGIQICTNAGKCWVLVNGGQLFSPAGQGIGMNGLTSGTSSIAAPAFAGGILTPLDINSGSVAKAQVASDFTLAGSTSLQTITGLTWTVLANAQNLSFHCALSYSQATAVVADAFGIQVATNAPTNVFANGLVQTNTTAYTGGTLATLSTTTATNILTFTPGATATNFTATLDGTIELPPSAHTINIMASQSNAGDLLTIKRGSYCQLF